MKKIRYPILGATLLIVVIMGSLSQAAPTNKKELILSKIIVQALNCFHYSPVEYNNEFRKNSFTLYINSLDSSKKFFLKSDVEQLRHYQSRIANDLTGGNFEFMEAANRILRKRINDIQRFFPEILSQPFNYDLKENLETDPEKRDFPANQKELKELWRKLLKSQTITTYLELINEPKYKNNQNALVKNPDPQLEAKARESTGRNIKSYLLRMLQEPRSEQLERYLNSIIGCYDPHSDYLPPQREEDFEISMSGSLEGIGASLREEGEYIKVEQIIPGSASWKQRELTEGDLILKVAEGDHEPVDITNMRIDDVVRLIRGKKGTEVKLTVKKPDGRIKVIAIIRDVVTIEDSFAKAAVIHNPKNGQKVGYISLPSFYHDFKAKSEPRSSAEDVRKELEKLKKEKVTGLILDLRNNGGGALNDVIEMAGQFIKEGPIVQVKDNDGKIQILEDADPKITFDAPLTILINSVSASASEILAAALQDYGRAVIVGGHNSFGKGTVQSLIDLDALLTSDYNQYKPLGSLKVTIQKYYRINGGSVQFKGVSSDITLPDATGGLKIGEKYLKHPLTWDTVAAASYQKWEGQPNLTTLRKNSTQRVRVNRIFQIINSNISQIKMGNEKSCQTLQLYQFWQEQELIRKQTEKLATIQNMQSSLQVVSVPGQNENISNSKWLQEIAKDPYINESINILGDMTKSPK